MARKITKKEPKWYEFPADKEIQFKLRPFSVLYLSKYPGDKFELTPEIIWEVFNNSVLDWKGILDDDDKPLECNAKNKRLLAEQDQELLLFASNKSSEISNLVTEGTAKNLQTSPNGEDPKVE